MNSFINKLVQQALLDKQRWTTQSIVEAATQASSTPDCEFLRLPPPGQKCPITGLKRGYLNLLILPCRDNDYKPPVRSFCLRRKGSAKGVRLIDKADLIRFIWECVEPAYSGSPRNSVDH
jgi:hypothetical protein